MAIIINIDVMLAKRRYYDGEYFNSEKRKGKSGEAEYFGQHLQSAAVSAGRYSGICPGRGDVRGLADIR